MEVHIMTIDIRHGSPQFPTLVPRLDSFHAIVWPLRNSFEHLPEFFRHLLDQFRSSVKLSRSSLKEFDAPCAIALGGDKCLMRVYCRIEVRLSWWHHPDDCA